MDIFIEGMGWAWWEHCLWVIQTSEGCATKLKEVFRKCDPKQYNLGEKQELGREVKGNSQGNGEECKVQRSRQDRNESLNIKAVSRKSVTSWNPTLRKAKEEFQE